MKPPILQTDWFNRVAFDAAATADAAETFFVHATHPTRAQALSVRLHLLCQDKERHGEVQALVTLHGKHYSATERWPVGRIEVDPERAGVGIGESTIEESASSGLVRGGDFAISWNLSFTDELPGCAALPARWLYQQQGVSPKMCTPHPAGVVNRGTLELWHGLARHVPLERIDLAGWRLMQGHRWGARPPTHFAWVLANTFEGQPRAYFELFGGPVRLGPLATPAALIGRMVIGKHVYRFDSWRHLFGSPSRSTPTDWQFELHGPDGHIKGVLKAPAAATLAGSAPGSGAVGHSFTNRQAQLTLDLTPLHGTTRSFVSQRAFYEVVQPQPRGAAQNAA